MHNFSKRPWVGDIIKLLILSGLVVWVLGRGSAQLGYNWQWYRIPQFLCTIQDGRLAPGPLIRGLVVTLQITACGLVTASFFGLVTALGRLSSSPMARIMARGYIESVRNTPLLVQLFFIYFVLSPVLDIGRFASAVLALSLFEGAYAAEIIRAGIQGIPISQWEAAASLGLGSRLTYRFVVLPQALRQMLPPLTSQAISLVKDSALVSTIAIYDLTMQGQAIVARTFLVFEVWFTVAFIYLVLTLVMSVLVRVLERRKERY
jgi:polar amino acid transport system permease protein